MDTLYPMFYGTRLVTMDVLRATFTPHMHPEAARRGFNFIEDQGGVFGIGGGYRAIGNQPDKPGFAPEGRSFHQPQQFPSGLYYVAWDLVVVNPGNVHKAPARGQAPLQGTQRAVDYGVWINTDESWHLQPIPLDGYDKWVNAGRYDLDPNYPIKILAPSTPEEPPVDPPTPEEPPVEPPVPEEPPAPPVVTEGIIVQFTSRNLTQGTSGKDVAFFQRIMNDVAGQGLTLDGQYGVKTTQAVKNWQTFFGLSVDGQMGPKTQQSIIEVALQV